METTPENINDKMARVIRMERASQQVTLRELSEKTGIAPATLMRIEKGERDIRVTDLHAIADGLGVEFQALIARAE